MGECQYNLLAVLPVSDANALALLGTALLFDNGDGRMCVMSCKVMYAAGALHVRAYVRACVPALAAHQHYRHTPFRTNHQPSPSLRLRCPLPSEGTARQAEQNKEARVLRNGMMDGMMTWPGVKLRRTLGTLPARRAEERAHDDACMHASDNYSHWPPAPSVRRTPLALVLWELLSLE